MKLQVFIRTCVLVITLGLACFTWADEGVSSININTANAEQLAEALKGVGMKTAKRIVSYRDEHGNFNTVAELANVKGIGATTIEKNITAITLE